MNKYFKFDLKHQQASVFTAIQDFVNDKDAQIFILRGYAGTGKTSLLSGVVVWLNENRIIFSLLASTGRAAKILSDKTESNATTIHSEIYVFSNLDDDLETISKQQEKMDVDDKGQISLMFELKPIISEKQKLYIIDESSMIGDTPNKGNSFAKFGSGELLKDLLKYDRNGKFIFSGDSAQLPPIGQSKSPALSKGYIEDKYNLNVQSYELTDVIRQSSTNGIIKASMLIRGLHSSNPYVKFASFPLKGHSNINIHNSHANLINSYIRTIEKNGYDYSTLICQTNRQCSDINTNVRNALGRKDNEIQIGDILLVTQNNFLTGLVNGDIVEVLKTGQREYRCGLSFLQIEIKELVSKNSYSILLLEDILYSISTNLTNKQHKDMMIDYYHRMKDNGIKQKDRMFKDGMLKDPYLNSLKAVYGYALTCHKSQGGEWEEVFLYLDNKIHGIPKPGIYQWLYTAVTRAKETLHVVDDWFIK